MLESLSNQVRSIPISMQNSFGGRYSLSLPNIARNLNKIAVPVVAFLALSYIQGASAGPFAYATCCSGCELACTQAGLLLAPTTAGWSVLAIVGGPVGCSVVCAPALTAPTP